MTNKEISDLFNIPYTIVKSVIANQSWKDVDYTTPEIKRTERRNKSYAAENNPAAKLTKQQVDDSRELYKITNMTVTDLSKMFKVSVTNMCNILKNKVWYDELYNPIKKENKGQFVSAKCCGENHKMAKLTANQINEIRKNEEKLTTKQLSEKYDVSCDNILRIVNNQTWFDESYIPQKRVHTGHFVKGQCGGESHKMAKLNNDKVKYIRENPDNLSVKQLSEKLKITASTIRKIINNTSWYDPEYYPKSKK